MEHLSAPGGNAPPNVTAAPNGAAAGHARGADDRAGAAPLRTFARRIDCWPAEPDEVRPAAGAR